VERDVRSIYWIQAMRAFLYGLATVIIGSGLHLSWANVGTFTVAMLVGMPIVSLAVGRYGERVGRRRMYAILLLVMAGAGTVPGLTSWMPLLVLVGLTGTLSPDPNESGPITSLEQAMLGQAPSEIRTRVYGRYNAVAYVAGAVGAVVPAIGIALVRHFSGHATQDQRWLLAFPVLGLACFVIALRLGDSVEADPAHRALAMRKPLDRSRSRVRKLAALFALDSFAGGFIVQLALVAWVSNRFHVGPVATGVIFFAAGLLQAASSIVAGWLAAKIGMLNTMVFTHLPSNVLLILFALVPPAYLPLAVVLLLLRFSLSQMDVPARQAYVAAMVEPQERTAAAAYTNTARYVSRPVGQAVSADVFIANGMVLAPILAAGSLKILYDLLIWKTFHRVPLPESERSSS
jgi:MFS family permease